MNKTSIATVAIALSALAAGQAMATSKTYYDETYFGPIPAVKVEKSREDVKAELEAAKRAGEILVTKNVNDETSIASGPYLKDVFPAQYPAAAKVAGKTREQVRAEVLAAKRAPVVVDYTNFW